MDDIHRKTSRDYISRVTDKDYPKAKAAEIAKEFGYDYWDGDRRICYGGYNYIEGYWERLAKKLVEYYKLPSKAKILDIGCGKGFLLYDIKKILPDAELHGIDISKYAIENSKKEISKFLRFGNATSLPWDKDTFDLVVSVNTLHNLYNYELEQALNEIERVGKEYKYICVESYRNEQEKANLMYWQVTCEAFNNPDEWKWWFQKTNYRGDYSLIYFE